jgi:hypothetical protein
MYFPVQEAVLTVAGPPRVVLHHAAAAVAHHRVPVQIPEAVEMPAGEITK